MVYLVLLVSTVTEDVIAAQEDTVGGVEDAIAAQEDTVGMG